MTKTILGLDISTTATGIFIVNKETNFHKLFEIKPIGNIEDRIVEIYKGVKKITEKYDYDIMAISKASYTQSNMQIMKLEGLILSLCIDHEKESFYQPDISWYVTLPNSRHKDERATKKRNSLLFMAEKLKISNFTIDDSQLPKEIAIITEDGKRLSDNISDAFCIAYQYDAIKEKKEIDWHKSELQTKINKLRADNKKLRNKKDKLKGDKKINLIEKKQFEEEYNLTKSKKAENAVMKRIDRDAEFNLKIEEYDQGVIFNNAQIDKLMKEKNTI